MFDSQGTERAKLTEGTECYGFVRDCQDAQLGRVGGLESGFSGYQGVCRCGWLGEIHAEHSSAQAGLAAHVAGGNDG